MIVILPHIESALQIDFFNKVMFLMLILDYVRFSKSYKSPLRDVARRVIALPAWLKINKGMGRVSLVGNLKKRKH